ncbi:hypothetical protein BO94DRAFT_103402 [Aspergillus sclerotioniger CBS 115572]|uniref:Uncharacterized protein n=1 Tax=Aspergillus sclerotioniger CBS 115572 TaxID=1450535 RepID=A0A317WDK9_9EURO|nr:hypothetical protein BO94DRAFT_103402 [Aspergillus sclerotioniger CBS 115572]PWY84556.1 hypothetical protein BO94DRAFT_103402 [Aspergillus sclerotioniger CBS 115572]
MKMVEQLEKRGRSDRPRDRESKRKNRKGQKSFWKVSFFHTYLIAPFYHSTNRFYYCTSPRLPCGPFFSSFINNYHILSTNPPSTKKSLFQNPLGRSSLQRNVLGFTSSQRPYPPYIPNYYYWGLVLPSGPSAPPTFIITSTFLAPLLWALKYYYSCLPPCYPPSPRYSCTNYTRIRIFFPACRFCSSPLYFSPPLSPLVLSHRRLSYDR